MSRLIECVPNFSEGRNHEVIEQIANSIRSVEGVKLLEVDIGFDANRTVMTFVGTPEKVVESAFRAFKTASEVIDMRKHSGEHPRLGATDVCPLVPISGIRMAEVVDLARALAKRVGDELDFSVYCYEASALKTERKNLAYIRSGEYEGLAKKLQNPIHEPDFGKPEFNSKTGATVIGARDFLVAYNINLNTKSADIATEIAKEIRESGKIIRNEKCEIIRDKKGKPVRKFGRLKGVKAIGWFMEEYDLAQVSTNITNTRQTPVHVAFYETQQTAKQFGVEATGSELIGLIPLKMMTEAGKFAYQLEGEKSKQNEKELVEKAVKFLGLDKLRAFDSNKKIIEYAIKNY
jgi:glutamate formiminotransferase/formiminotetrahydrofolate cyclodeaminase